ncbi:hypothetical protein RZS08_33415, partial [Arthrospira platensis SPKY1]|nr:hypothetical protein [Arthrospira platensis SPKY1]
RRHPGKTFLPEQPGQPGTLLGRHRLPRRRRQQAREQVRIANQHRRPPLLGLERRRQYRQGLAVVAAQTEHPDPLAHMVGNGDAALGLGLQQVGMLPAVPVHLGFPALADQRR